ncbi:MAG: pyridoxamine 5'-phosphate oxidase family protein [Micrococcales bacterium]|nr:pyridoxamine 5'-phosphate oxidase family protein [Micrococcales bacterium]
MVPNTSPTTEHLPESECWKLLRGSTLGRLAVVVDGAPDLFPVNYVVDHGSIVFRTAEGSKLLGSSNQRVAFEVDGLDDKDGPDVTVWSVVVKGIAAQIREHYAAIDAMDLPITPWEGGFKPHFVRIDPTSVTGRRIHVVSEVSGQR